MDALTQQLISPVVLCFLLGAVSRWIRSDLALPEAVYSGLSIYLLFAIGLKGGVALSQTSFTEFYRPALGTILIGVVTPFIAFYAVRYAGKLSKEDSAAVAAHYGSVSVVTFLASVEAAKRLGLESESYLSALVALLEIPGIVIALLFARSSNKNSWSKALHEVVTGKSIVLLAGGMLIGALCGKQKVSELDPLFVGCFKGALCLFMIELGIVASKRLRDAARAGFRLITLGFLLPPILGAFGVAVGLFCGLSVGGAMVLGSMSASASYIAAPAAVRIALPEANPAYYLTLALGITFPFNIALGIPLYAKISHHLSLWL
jgi:hypothetical protein